MRLTPEKRVQNKIIAYLSTCEDKGDPLLYFRRDAIGPNYKKGVPDIYLIYGKYHVEIEVKKPGGTPSADQERWQRRYKKIGAIYWIVDSYETFLYLFKNLKEGTPCSNYEL